MGRLYRIILATAVVVSGFASHGVQAQEAVSTGDTAQRGNRPALKIATYNINWGNPDLKSVVKTIQEADADIVCLQETNGQSEPYLQQALGQSYRHIAFRGHKGRLAAERVGILSRRPIQKLTFFPPKDGLFGFAIADVQWGRDAVQIAIVHLEPMMLQRGSGFREALSALGAMEETHEKEIAHVYENLRRDTPTIIAGDFNSLSDFRAPAFLKQRGFVDSFAAVHEHPNSQPTWHWPLKFGEISLRIDFVFHSSHFQTTESRILPSRGSDHYLVVSSLSSPKAPTRSEK